MTIDKNDPRLTSFVLGELSDNELNEIRTAVEQNAALQAEVEAIRQTVAELETTFRNEPLPALRLKPKPARVYRNLVIAAASLLVAAVCAFLFNAPERKVNAIAVNRIQPLTDEAAPATEAAVKKDTASAVEVTITSKGDGVLPEQESLQVQTAKQEVPTALAESAPTADMDGKSGGGYSGKPGAMGVMRSSKQSGEEKMGIGRQITYSDEMSISESRQSIRSQERRVVLDSLSGRSQAMPKRESAPTFMNEIAPRTMPPVNIPDDSYNSEKNESYKTAEENPFKNVKIGEFSTFSIDVDTASYSTMRRYIQSGHRPPEDSVRIEEFINYFQYGYEPPADGKPFAVYTDVAKCPWQPKHLLAKIGIKGKVLGNDRPPLNLVFLVDTSGSMESSNRLPLVIKSLTDLVEMLQSKDHIAIVTYAGSSHIALPSVSGSEKRAILDSLNSLQAGGSTAGAQGIKTAYEVARKYFDKEAQNRIVLCTDGDFNVGETDNNKLETMIADEAKSGVFLTILGFGMGNYKDERLKTLSMKGNGNYGYIDTLEEARKLLVEGLTGTLFAIAKDVKIQVDFNPAKIAGYRLIGYETRKLKDEDFHNDKVDAGEIGAGHTVTAFYEIVPAGVDVPQQVDKSRYDSAKKPEEAVETPPNGDELLFVKLRYKAPDGDKSSLLEYPVKTIAETASSDFQFASGVALFGMLLRHSQYCGDGTFDTALKLCEPNVQEEKYRKEFIDLVKKAQDTK